MVRRALALLCAAFAGTASFAEPTTGTAGGRTIVVGSDSAFAAAVAKLRVSGGRIVLRAGWYRRLVVGPRSWRPLRIVGMRGARVQDVFFDGTQRVSVGRVSLRPGRSDALVEVRASRHVELHHLSVSAVRTRRSASVLIPDSRDVTIRDSDFSHCGDRARDFVNCVTIYRWSHDVRITGNRFHDCFGCDFVNGRFGSDLTIRGNRFERALPCRMGRHRCGHNDLVQLFGGRRLRVARNHFGVYRAGGAQLYLTNAVDYAVIVNNVFVGSDPRVPGYQARIGIVLGSNESERMPRYARIVNNSILTGYRRRDGYAGSLRMNSRYGAVKRWMRPIIANNVIGLLATPARVCNGAQRFVANLVISGKTCSAREAAAGPLELHPSGRPTAYSPVIDSAHRYFAPPIDFSGRRRVGHPDIGAFEFR